MEIDRELVLHIAHLANLELSDAEVTLFTKQLSEIVHYIDKLNEIDEQAEPFTYSFYLPPVARPDVVVSSLTQEEALRNAPLTVRGFFKVPKIIP